MIFPSFHLIIKQCHNQWRSSLFRTTVVINQRQLATIGAHKRDYKQQENNVLVQSQNNQTDIITFTQKGISIFLENNSVFLIIILYHSTTSC